MTGAGGFIGWLLILVDRALVILEILIVINALLSWVRPDPSSPIVRFLDRVSDTVCDPIRRFFPTVLGGFDLAPLIAILVIEVVRWLLRAMY